MSQDQIKDRIKKLLKLADDDSALDGEINNALQFARTLMRKHHISAEELKEEPRTPSELQAVVEETEYAREGFQTHGTRMTAWETDLYWSIARLVGTVGWYIGGRVTRRCPKTGVLTHSPHTGKPVTATQLYFYGPAEDVADAKALALEWQITIAAMARLKYGGALRGPGRSYAEGFAVALRRKLSGLLMLERQQSENYGTMEGEDRSKALAIVDAGNLMVAKRDAATPWLERRHGIRLRKPSGSIGHGADHGEARAAGRKDGEDANFSHTRTKKLGR